MDIGSLEYFVIGLSDDRFTREVLLTLQALQETFAVQVVDLPFVHKDADGVAMVREGGELEGEAQVWRSCCRRSLIAL